MDWGERFGRIRSLLQTKNANHQHSRQLMLMLDRAFEVDTERCTGELCAYVQSSLTSKPWPTLTFLAHEKQVGWWAHVPALIWLRCGQSEDFETLHNRFPFALWSLGFSPGTSLDQILSLLASQASQQIALLDLNELALNNDAILSLTSITTLGNLRVLMLEDNQISEEGAVHLSKAQHWPALNTIYLDGNTIKKSGRNALKKAMPQVTCHWS